MRTLSTGGAKLRCPKCTNAMDLRSDLDEMQLHVCIRDNTIIALPYGNTNRVSAQSFFIERALKLVESTEP